MVCVQEVLLWFKDMNQSVRIEVICGLFDMCTPFELRFFWTLLETYGKRDSFDVMKDTQLKLCTESEILKLSNLTDTVVRSNLLISLILIESTNRRCASIIYNLIIEQLQTEKLTLMLHTDIKCVHDVVLMLTLASHHPAFSFQEQSVLSDKLLKLKETFLPTQDYEVYNNAVWSFSTLTPPPSNDLEILPVLAENPALAVTTNYIAEWPNDLSTPQAQIEPVRTQLSSLEICGFEKNRGFRIKALWSNGKSYEVIRSYPEIFNFHQKLLQAVAHITPIGTSELSIPHLPIDEGTIVSVPQMAEFFRQLTNNVALLNNDAVLSFLSSKAVPPPLTSTQLSTIDSNSYGQQPQFQQVPPYLDGAIVQTSPPSNINESRPSSRPSVLPSSSSPGPSPLSSPVSSPFVSPPASGTSSRSASPWQTQQQGFNTAYPPTSYHRNNPSVPRVLRTKNSNPGNNCGSSSSSSSSGYGNGQGSRSNNSKVGSGDICLLEQLLTRERLRKYIDNLRPYRIHELQGMSQDDLENVGLMKGAAGKLKKVLDSIGTNPPNGANMFHHRNHHHHQCAQNHKAPVSSNSNACPTMPVTQISANYNFSPSSPGSESSSPPPSPPLLENNIQGQNSRTSSSDENLSAGKTPFQRLLANGHIDSI